jgi:hypothetical protein
MRVELSAGLDGHSAGHAIRNDARDADQHEERAQARSDAAHAAAISATTPAVDKCAPAVSTMSGAADADDSGVRTTLIEVKLQ